MTTRMLEVEHPFDGRRRAVIVTDDKEICEALAKNPEAEITISVKG